MLKFRFILVLFLAWATALHAADIQSVGVPYIQNYTKAQYQSGNQNWSVTRDERGIMYFGNTRGLLAFDGRYWQLHRMPNRSIARAVAADGRGKVYAGGFGELGYWAYDIKGRYAFTSLSPLIPGKYGRNDEIWKIYVLKDRVLFQSFARIYQYKGGKISVIDPPRPNLFLLHCRDRLFMGTFGKGLFELKGNRFEFIAGSEGLTSGVLTILPFRAGAFLIGTAKQGLFLYDRAGIRPFGNQANDFLKTYQLNNGALVLGKYFAFGTILNGIVIVDADGNLIQKINKASGLQNNTVLSLYTDANQNLWAGLDNGIDRVDINSPLYFYFDKSGKFGTVYASIIHRDKIYLGTNQGLFYSDWSTAPRRFQTFDFKLVPGTQGQVWDLALLDGQLLCGHNDGTFRIVDGRWIEKLSTASGGYTIRRLNGSPNLAIQGTYTGLAIYRRLSSGRWAYSHKVDGFGELSHYVVQDQKNNFWVSHAYKGLFKLQLSDDLKKVIGRRAYSTSAGLPGDYHINCFRFNDRIVFTSDSGMYTYDDVDDRFVNYRVLNRKLGSYRVSSKIIEASPSKYWFFNGGRIALVTVNTAGGLRIDSTSFGILEGRMVDDYQNISRVSNSLSLVSTDDGFVIYNSATGRGSGGKVPEVNIRRVENTTSRTLLIAEDSVNNITLPAKSSIRISYALPFYSQTPVRYQYFLDNYSEGWSEWTTQAQKEFTNLSPGTYRFQVRALVASGTISPATTLTFAIGNPWYTSFWAILVYLLIAAAVVYLVHRYNRYRMVVHQRDIEQKMLMEQEEHRRKEAEANEQRIIRIRNEQLQTELENKGRELTNLAMNIVYKNELLQRLREEIHQIKDDGGRKLSEDRLKKIQKVIDDGMSDEHDWNLFENSFNETHESFFKKLKHDHPELVPNDVKLCAYLRMNMSSKEIASLLNITLRSVEIRRYRLRKKLDIPQSKNLVEFLMEL